MTHPEFKISVLMPAYNAEKYIAESIGSVLDQTLRPAEILIFDDGSTDGTKDVIKKYGDAVTCHGQEHLGFIGARNYLLEQAGFEWLAFHDADDIWLPHKLEKQVAYLQTRPDMDGCLGMAVQFLEPGCTLPASFRQELLQEPTAQLFIPNLLTSRSVFNRVGKFEREDATGSDSDWFVRARDSGIQIGVIQEVLYRRRWHQTNLSYGFTLQNNMLDILRRSILRKRQRD